MAEKENLSGLPAAIGMIILAMLFLGLVFAIYPGWAAVGKFMTVNLRLTADAPAWVQAVGSVGAILVAIWVSNSTERTAKQHSLINARAFASATNSSFNAMKLAVEASNTTMVLVCQGALNEALASGRVIKAELLPATCIGSVLSLRAISAAILVASVVYTNNPNQYNQQQLQSVLNEYWVPITKHVIELSRGHSGLPEVV